MIEETVELINLLGKDNAEKVKSAITKVLIDNIEESVNELYLITQDEIDDMCKDLLNEVKEEVRQNYKDLIIDKVNSSMDKFFRD